MELLLKMEVDFEGIEELTLAEKTSAITEIIQDGGRATNSHINIKNIHFIEKEAKLEKTSKNANRLKTYHVYMKYRLGDTPIKVGSFTDYKDAVRERDRVADEMYQSCVVERAE
ncbi:hypothetical protein [Shouchella clausii]|uniref:hypothetical protein n=1 Tax=Shouchella clausii TaxID=79880 RepID=UPI001C735EF0|nr:hypothetical protein [Shouchella clausii]MBX0320312.1 hypothetical protein [Shouchella clausii]